MVDQCSFFSETLTWVDDNTFFFSSNTSRQHVIFYHLSPCVSFSIWTIHRATNGSIWRFHLGMFTLSYPFQHIFRQNIWSPSCPNFIMFWPTIYAWFTTRLIFLTFRLFSSIFYIVFHMRLGLPPSFNCRHTLMCMHTSHQPYGYPLLMLCSWQQTHWNPWCKLQHFCRHCARCLFSRGTRTITYVSFNHIQLLLLMSRHCAYQIWHLHLSQRCHCRPNVSEFTSSILCNSRICCRCHCRPNVSEFTSSILCNSRICCLWCGLRTYYNRHRIDQFLPLTIEVFGCLHKHSNVFLHNCANAICSLKGIEGLHLSTLVTFLH